MPSPGRLHWIGRKVPNSAERKKHIIYRGNSLPFWLGNAAYRKKYFI